MNFLKQLRELTANSRNEILEAEIEMIKNDLAHIANSGDDFAIIYIDDYKSSSTAIVDRLRKEGLTIPGTYNDNGRFAVRVEWTA